MNFFSVLSRIILVCFCWLIGFTHAIAQDDEKKDTPKNERPEKEFPIVIPEFKPSIRGFFKLPNALANNSFKKIFNGVSNLEVTYVHPFAKNFFAGAGIQHGYYDINKFSFPEVSIGNMQAFMAFGEGGHQRYVNERWYYTVSLRVGYGLVAIHSENCNTLTGEVPQESMLFNEEMVGVYLRGNERMSYGLVVSHQIYHFAFNPGWLCRTSFSGLTGEDYAGYSNSFTIGFGFTCILGKIE